MQVTNKAEIFQLESDDQFLCILTNDEYLESKLKLESLLTDNQTLNNELELTQLTDESAITLSNNLKLELKLKEDEVTEKEKKIQFIEDDLRVVNEKLKQRLLKSEEDDKMMVRLIQELKNEAENKRMEEFYGQQTFNESNVRWNQKYKEELDKINKLKREGTSKKRKSTSSSSAISVKQMKRQSFESGLDEHTDEEDVSKLINYRLDFIILSYFQDFNITFNTDSEF